jgi:hypothetical protein
MYSTGGIQWKEALEAPLTLVTPRSIFVGVRAELTLGALEAILTSARPIALEAICTLGAKADRRPLVMCVGEGVSDAVALWPDFELRFSPT